MVAKGKMMEYIITAQTHNKGVSGHLLGNMGGKFGLGGQMVYQNDRDLKQN